MKAIIAPSILACDFSNLQSECEKVLSQGAEWLHLDVMDGFFVPNLTFGAPVLQSLRKKLPNAFFDCHLMVQKPELWIEAFANIGANQYTFHIESEYVSLPDIIDKIKQKNMRVGIALKPNTEINPELEDQVRQNKVDMILIMTVEPGNGGQKFMENMLKKVQSLRLKYPSLDIQVDGGINCDNIEKCAKAGANIIVSGTGIYDHKDMKYAIDHMKNSVQKEIKL